MNGMHPSSDQIRHQSLSGGGQFHVQNSVGQAIRRSIGFAVASNAPFQAARRRFAAGSATRCCEAAVVIERVS